MGGLIIEFLWIVLTVLVLGGLYLAALWILRRYLGMDIPDKADKFGIAVILLLAIIWTVSLVLGGPHPGLYMLR